MNLRRVMQQSQNRSRALEVRLEEETERKYYVVIAGMTVYNQQCRGGVCDSTPQGEYLYTDNETYSCQSYSDVETAKKVYFDYKASYID